MNTERGDGTCSACLLAGIHYRNDLSALTLAGIFPAQTLCRAQPGCSRGAVLPKARNRTQSPRLMGLDAVPEDVGSGTSRGGVQVPKLLLLLLLPAAAGRAGTGLTQSCAKPAHTIPAASGPQGIQKGITTPLLGCWDSSSVFWRELGLELQLLDKEHPQQSLGSDSEPQSSLSPVTSLTVPPKRGV